MKTRCRGCRKLIEFGNTYCDKCSDKFKNLRKDYKTEKTKEADKFISTARWQSLRREIIRRDKGCCVYCFLQGRIEYRKLQVHHIVKRTEDLSLVYEPTNLITVCKNCHEKVEKMSVREQRKLFNLEEINNEEIHYLL